MVLAAVRAERCGLIVVARVDPERLNPQVAREQPLREQGGNMLALPGAPLAVRAGAGDQSLVDLHPIDRAGAGRVSRRRRMSPRGE